MENNNHKDVNAEFDILFPPTKRLNLFDSEKDYETLRNYIINQPYSKCSTDSLPFCGVNILPYIEFKKQSVIEKELEKSRHIFFLKQSEKGKVDYCDAAGYYEENTGNFVLLPYSHIINKVSGYIPKILIRKGKYDGTNLYITNEIIFDSPIDAASFVLGKRAGFEEWIDSKGKCLLLFYNILDKLNEKISLDIKSDSNNDETTQPKHIFHIKTNGVCDASGYYDTISKFFYLIKGSKIVLNVPEGFALSPIGKARERLVNTNCIKIDGYYVVTKDTRCRTATAAACYATGQNVTYIEWEDDNGLALKDYFPNIYNQKKLSTSVNNGIIKDELFYLNSIGASNKNCEAVGYYDVILDSFIIKEGSLWSLEVSKSYYCTASELKRRTIIKKSCRKNEEFYKQFIDVRCDTPTQAATYILGREVDGRDLWVNKTGRNIKDILNLG